MKLIGGIKEIFHSLKFLIEQWNKIINKSKPYFLKSTRAKED